MLRLPWRKVCDQSRTSLQERGPYRSPQLKLVTRTTPHIRLFRQRQRVRVASWVDGDDTCPRQIGEKKKKCIRKAKRGLSFESKRFSSLFNEPRENSELSNLGCFFFFLLSCSPTRLSYTILFSLLCRIEKPCFPFGMFFHERSDSSCLWSFECILSEIAWCLALSYDLLIGDLVFFFFLDF